MSTIPPDEPRHPMTRSPLATPEVVAREPNPFPSTSVAAPHETWFPDWRRRLTGNLSRRSDGRWEPLTRTHGPERADAPAEK